MKTIILLSLAFSFQISFSQNNFKKEIKYFQNTINKQYADTAESPLLKEDLAKFKSLDFYPAKKKYKVEAKFTRTKDAIPFKMKTTTDRAPEYVKYGNVEFEIDGKKIKVGIYQSLRLKEKEEYKDYLFLPFRDLTSGKTSYGGGRYVDLKIPEGNTIIIDFNKAYNPYCAYNHKYSCVVPPLGNFIAAEIKAGVMKFAEH
ncbi:MAG: DUF1684 domain-containing protein [Bacteroidales bacterium]|nr:DUF1684 domain-containing protein [Bacteroidales bacterium]